MFDHNTMFGKIIKHYVNSNLNNKSKITVQELLKIQSGIQNEVIKEIFQSYKGDLLDKARIKAQEEKRKIIKRVKLSLIIETIFIAFLVGIIVNQVTNFIPCNNFFSIAVIIIALIICLLMVLLTTGNDWLLWK